MRHTARLLARLYPSSWRRRYGAEFDALLEDTKPTARDAIDIVWGAMKMQITRWGPGRFVLACSFAALLLASAIALAMPVHYVSRAMITVDPANQVSLRALDHLGRDIFSRESLKALIQLDNIYARERAHLPLDNVAGKMRQSIRVESVRPRWPGRGDTLTFAITFDYPDPQVANWFRPLSRATFLLMPTSPTDQARLSLKTTA
jgi:hypothetical protein